MGISPIIIMLIAIIITGISYIIAILKDSPKWIAISAILLSVNIIIVLILIGV